MFFDFSEVFFTLVLFSPLLDQAILMQDTADGFVAAGQMLFTFEAFGTLKGELFSQLDDFFCQTRGGFMRAAQGNARQLVQTSQPLLAITVQPLADGLGRGVKEDGGGFDSSAQGLADDPQAEIELVGFAGHSS